MADWAKIKFFWDTMLGSSGSTLTATNTDTSGDYDVGYIHNMLETNSWQASSATTPIYITCDAGAGNTRDADFLAIIGHNLSTAGATITLQYSATGAWAGEEIDAFTAEAVAADTVYLKEFTAPGAKRYWRLKITGTLSGAPNLSICIWGEKTELDYATASFDPHAEFVRAKVNLSQGGFVTGIHSSYSERELTLSFSQADQALYAKVRSWWEGSGLNNFFLAWDTANNPSEVWLMRPNTNFFNPLTNGGALRNISVSLRGRKEGA